MEERAEHPAALRWIKAPRDIMCSDRSPTAGQVDVMTKRWDRNNLDTDLDLEQSWS